MEGLRPREGEEEEEGGGGGEGCSEHEQQAAVYCAVAVGKEEWKANLRWVLATFSFPRSRRLVLAHLHRPPSRINIMGAWVPVSQLAEEEVTAYRQLEEEKVNQVLDGLLAICRSQKVNASKIIVACGDNDAARGLIQLVHDHGVAELVMGAASDRGYTRKMRAPRSKKALMVQRKANPSCKIWFVCEGNLICTREPSEGLNRAESSTTSTSPRSSASDNSRFKSSRRIHSEPLISMQESADQATSAAGHTPSREDDTMDSGIEDSNHEATAFVGSSTVSVSGVAETEGESSILQSLREIEEDLPTTSQDGLDGDEMDDELYDKLKDALLEAENLRHETHEETRRRQKAERDLADATKMAMDAESSWRREAKHRKEVEEMLARERAAMEQDKQELDGMLEQTHQMNHRCAELELQITSSERAMGELQARLSESYGLLGELRREVPASDRAPIETDTGVSFLRLGYSELEEATNHFDESARIGLEAGGRGTVYRGSLRGMAVAIKVIRPDAAVDEARFTREVEAISVARHPDLVAVVGACPEARAVVYELVAGGSLEERLAGGERPLPWHARCGVAYRACAALAFLYSTRPRPTVHGGVTAANILLDEGRSSSKLGGFGMRRLVVEHGGGVTPAVAYMEPGYLATGEARPRCDVYSLGVVLLRLVSGRAAFAAKKAAREAAGGRRAWEEVVDEGGAGWPVERGREVALLGLDCCDGGGEPREMLEEARRVLEGAMATAPGRTWAAAPPPPYFVCPILREVMRDPQIAGDGFTYEAEAMRGWLESGHRTSPMTNLELPTRDLIPNHALRSAIQQWRDHVWSNSFRAQ